MHEPGERLPRTGGAFLLCPRPPEQPVPAWLKGPGWSQHNHYTQGVFMHTPNAPNNRLCPSKAKDLVRDSAHCSMENVEGGFVDS